MSTEVSNQVADLGTDGSVLVNYEDLELVVNVCVVDVFVEIFRDSCKLGN